MSRFFVSLALILGFEAAYAAPPSVNIRPGLWEMTMAGMPMKQTVCITPEMVNDPKRLSQQQQQANTDCKMSNEQSTSSSWSMHMSCTKPEKMESDVKMTVLNSDAYQMQTDYVMNMGGQMQKGSMTMNYKRIGDCKK